MARFRDRSYGRRRRSRGSMLRYALALLVLLLLVIWIWSYDLENSTALSWMTGVAPARSAIVSDYVFRDRYSGGYSSALKHPVWTSFDIIGDRSMAVDSKHRMAPDSRPGPVPEPPAGRSWLSLLPAGTIGEDSLHPVAIYCLPDTFIPLWEELLLQSEKWAKEYGQLEAVTGIVGGSADVNGQPYCPDSLFYAILLRSEGEYNSIAFVLSVRQLRFPLLKSMVTVNEAERLSGTDLFGDLLGDDIEEKVESRRNSFFWAYDDQLFNKRIMELNKIKTHGEYQDRIQ